MQSLLQKNDKCPIYDNGFLKYIIKNDEIKIKHKTYQIENVELLQCDNCNDGFYTDETLDKFEEVMNKLRG